MNILQVSSRIRKTAEKEMLAHNRLHLSAYGKDLNNEELASYKNYVIDRELKKLEEDCKIALRIKEILVNQGISNPEKDLINKWCLITIRPDEIKNIHDFKCALLKALESKKILNFEMAFEQTGKEESELGKGAHAHILTQVQDYCTIKDILTIFKVPLKNYVYSIQVGNEHRKFIPDSIGLERAKNYIRGNKHNEAKEANVALDPLWRERNNLLPLYTSPNQVQGSV